MLNVCQVESMKKIAGVVLGLLLLASCGFEPLYVKKQNNNLWYFSGDFDTSISKEMAQVKVEAISDRFGQQIRNQLLDLLTPLGVPRKPRYRLYVEPQKKDVIQQALRRDITATRERVRYAVNYRLVDEADNKDLVTGNSVTFVSYDILANPYSTTMAQKKTEEDAAKIIANDVALRLGAYFHKAMSPKDNTFDL